MSFSAKQCAYCSTPNLLRKVAICLVAANGLTGSSWFSNVGIIISVPLPVLGVAVSMQAPLQLGRGMQQGRACARDVLESIQEGEVVNHAVEADGGHIDAGAVERAGITFSF